MDCSRWDTCDLRILRRVVCSELHSRPRNLVDPPCGSRSIPARADRLDRLAPMGFGPASRITLSYYPRSSARGSPLGASGGGAPRSPRAEHDLRKSSSRQPPSSGVGFTGLRIARTATIGAGLYSVWPSCARPPHHRRLEVSHFLGMPRAACGNTLFLSGFPSRRQPATHRLTAAS